MTIAHLTTNPTRVVLDARSPTDDHPIAARPNLLPWPVAVEDRSQAGTTSPGDMHLIPVLALGALAEESVRQPDVGLVEIERDTALRTLDQGEVSSRRHDVGEGSDRLDCRHHDKALCSERVLVPSDR